MTRHFAPGDLVRARGREWVALPTPRSGWLHLRPLSGSETDTALLNPRLEVQPVEPATFDLPPDAPRATQSAATLLADALQLSLRRGAGPFRSAAQLNVEPRGYQLVPLLMALRQAVPRLLIADDVGIGKTIEAGLILREFMDRGEASAFSVLCPPHLVEQWTRELKERFGIDATAITAASAARLERQLPVSQSLFEAYPHTIVSLDYIKAEKRRDGFARSCPDFVIIDEAHACVGTHKGRQQRFELLRGLAADSSRRMIMLTATPHSGDEEAFGRLLSLIDPYFTSQDFGSRRYRERLARHFVQRRRGDLEGEWDEERAFPRHLSTDAPYALDEAHRAFHEAVLDYCLGVVSRTAGGQRERRLAFWGTLALMRCVGSSPDAALSALRTRARGEAEKLEDQLYDEDGDDEDAVDVEPTGLGAIDGDLADLIAQAETLSTAPDPKLDHLVKLLKPLVREGAAPVVFCRYIATADRVGRGLKAAFPKAHVEVVTGMLTSDERRDRVAAMEGEEPRILVATDCLSEGINLQLLFDTVVHYDLSWNPTRHQQREGRVNRFGQPAAEVRSALMFSPDSAIDGAVLDVILRKAEAIREATGVAVPLPDERGPVTDALMASMVLRRRTPQQYDFFDQLTAGAEAMERTWRDAEDAEKKSRSLFAQGALKPEEVLPEWRKTRRLLGGAAEAKRFLEAAMARFDAPVETVRGEMRAHVHALPESLRERLSEKELDGTLRLVDREPVPAQAALIGRAHPLTATLAEALVESALEPGALDAASVGRLGAWASPAVAALTRIVLLRLRFKLTVHTQPHRLLLAEEAALVAMQDDAIVASGEEARALLDAPAAYGLSERARDRLIGRAHEAVTGPLLGGPLTEHAHARAVALSEDHARLREAARSAPRVTVEPVLPPDLIALYALTPAEGPQ
ncbi:DEAD/DEAH box helicase [Rhodosalinus sediminis]|uniref:DEAD/DEAH box helicase n=1 Tax=Rhodosalinus sediminis TaxID=1940533 RepID=UPI002356633F|nr:DEAD/DEAH box helicase [Rhodosalinus sediminis]